MPAVRAAPSAKRVPRTSSSIAERESITFTGVPSQRPSARSRQASSPLHSISTTVARIPARHRFSGQVCRSDGASANCRVGSRREATAFAENGSRNSEADNTSLERLVAIGIKPIGNCIHYRTQPASAEYGESSSRRRRGSLPLAASVFASPGGHQPSTRKGYHHPDCLGHGEAGQESVVLGSEELHNKPLHTRQDAVESE